MALCKSRESKTYIFPGLVKTGIEEAVKWSDLVKSVWLRKSYGFKLVELFKNWLNDTWEEQIEKPWSEVCGDKDVSGIHKLTVPTGWPRNRSECQNG